MHATIQKPIEEIAGYIKPGEKVFIVGCGNCAMKCHSGGEREAEIMAGRLKKRGINVAGYTVPKEWIDDIESVDKPDRKKKAAEMMGRFIKKHKSKFQGVHIMPLGWTDIVPDILEHAEIKMNGSKG